MIWKVKKLYLFETESFFNLLNVSLLNKLLTLKFWVVVHLKS